MPVLRVCSPTVSAEPGGQDLEDIIDELARVLHEPGAAREFVLRTGFSPADLPAFDVPRVFWSRVIRAVADGKTAGGVQALVELAVTEFPGNGFFASYWSSTAVASGLPSQQSIGAVDNRGASMQQQIITQRDATFEGVAEEPMEKGNPHESRRTTAVFADLPPTSEGAKSRSSTSQVELTNEQRRILAFLAEEEIRTDRRVPGRVLRLRFRGDLPGGAVNEILDTMPTDLVSLGGYRRPQEDYGLTLGGFLAAPTGERVASIIEGTLKYFDRRLEEDPYMANYNWPELRNALALSDEDYNLAHVSLRAAGLHGSGGSSGRNFSYALPYDIEDLLLCQGIRDLQSLRHRQAVLRDTASDEPQDRGETPADDLAGTPFGGVEPSADGKAIQTGLDDEVNIDGLTADATRVLHHACELILRENSGFAFVEGGEDLLVYATPPLSQEACRDAIDLLVEGGYVGATPVFGNHRKWISFVVTPAGFREYASLFLPDFYERKARLIERLHDITADGQSTLSSALASDLYEQHTFVCLVLEDLVELGLLAGKQMGSGDWAVYNPSARLKRNYGGAKRNVRPSAPELPRSASAARRPLTVAAVKGTVDFGILTIREDEFEAVLERFSPFETIKGRRAYNLHRLALPSGGSYLVAVVRCIEQGNTEALDAARDVFEELAPQWLLVVGIAGGVPSDEISLGDVVVSTRIVDFSVEAVLQDRGTELALAGGPVHRDAAAWVANLRAMKAQLQGWSLRDSIGLERPSIAADDDENFYGDEAWQRKTRRALARHVVRTEPTVTAGTIASSDRLVKDTERLNVLLRVARQVVAVEMESAGVYRAASGRNIPSLAIRGLSDVVGFARDPRWTSYACHSAAAFTAAFLRTRPIEPQGSASADVENGHVGGWEAQPPSEPGPDVARLEALYKLREENVIRGKDTTQIDAELLTLRRRMRHGPTLHAGEHLGEGRFRLLEVVGRGGFAVVWKAYDNKERRLVAVKVLHGEFAQVASRRERLFRGAKRMAELQHPHVVRVLVPEGEEEGFYYFVMELVAGGDLHRAVIDGTLDTDRALDAVESIAEALEAAHTSGLVHRDVKPENILLRETGVPVLTDFDLVQAQDTTGGTRTAAMGSVLYAAPEQNEDASRVDHRADVYSLGMTAVFCVFGKKLPSAAMFQRDAFLSGLACTSAVREVLQRAVKLEPTQRFDSMASFRVALATARREQASEHTRSPVAQVDEHNVYVWHSPYEVAAEDAAAHLPNGAGCEGEFDLIERVATSVRPVVFLFGSALTMQLGPGLAGMPGVRRVVEMVREALGPRPNAALEDAVAREDFSTAYRTGIEALLKRRGQDAVNQVIRRTVLEAHDVLGQELQAKVLAGHPAEHRAACQALLDDPAGWRLGPSVAALGEILTSDVTKFPRVLTTNFDPLIEIAVQRARGLVRRTILSHDPILPQHGGAGTHIVYVHGYWFGADTLHTEVQLGKAPPQLEAMIKLWIERSLLVVLGYSGWDDVLMASLTALAADEAASPEIAWGFYGEQDMRVVKKLEAAGGRFQAYEHVDMHRLLPALLARLRADRGLGGASGTALGTQQPEWLDAPYDEPPAADASSVTLLRAERGVVRMSGREPELEDFAKWCEGGGLGVRLVTAPGGHGKTRLLRELCKRQIEAGWTAGIVRRSASLLPGLVDMARAERPLLLAIDYAEMWGEDLEKLLRELTKHRGSDRGIRVVLAARDAAEWWQGLPTAVEGLRDVLERFDAVRKLNPLNDVKALWADAVRGFSKVRGGESSTVVEQPVEVLQAWMKEGVLALHVAALLAVEGDPPPPDAGVERLFDELLRREAKKHWRPKADRLIDGRVANLDEVLRTIACIATLVGPLEAVEQARDILKRTPGLGGQDEATLDGLAQVFAELYPATNGEAVALPAVRPDRIGERLVATQIERKPSLAEVPFQNADDGFMCSRALRVLGRAAYWQPPLVGRLETLVRQFPGALVRAWIAVAPEEQWAPRLAMNIEAALEGLEELSPEEADALVQPLPLGSVALRGVAALLAVRAAEGIPVREIQTSATESELAAYARKLGSKGLRLGELGKREEALQLIEAALEHYRYLAQQNPDKFLPHLAGTLNNLGNIQSQSGKPEEALKSTAEAVGHYRELAKQTPNVFLPELAMGLNNLGVMQGNLGKHEEALESAEEAVDRYRELSIGSQDTYKPYLAGSLTNLGSEQRVLGKREDALKSAEQAVSLYQELAKQRPDMFLPPLARSLNNLGPIQGTLGKQEDALESAEEASGLYKELAKQRPDVFLSSLASSLANLGVRQSELGKRDEALESTEKATGYYRELAEQAPDTHLPDLAKILNNLGTMQHSLGRRNEALGSTENAVEHYRMLAKRRPEAYLPDLAGAISNLGAMQSDLGKQREALTSVEEAVDLWRELAKQRREAFLPDLAMSLNNLGAMQSDFGKQEEALMSMEAACEHYQDLAKRYPDEFSTGLATSLNNLANIQSELGKREEALASAETAVSLRRELANQLPDAYLPDLAMSLTNLGARQSELGKREEALASSAEAVTLYLDLFQRWPEAFARNFEISLRYHHQRLAELGRSPAEDAIALAALEALKRGQS